MVSTGNRNTATPKKFDPSPATPKKRASTAVPKAKAGPPTLKSVSVPLITANTFKTPTNIDPALRDHSVAPPSTESTSSPRTPTPRSRSKSNTPSAKNKRKKITTPTDGGNDSEEEEDVEDAEEGDGNGTGNTGFPWTQYPRIARALIESAYRQVVLGLQNGVGFKLKAGATLLPSLTSYWWNWVSNTSLR